MTVAELTSLISALTVLFIAVTYRKAIIRFLGGISSILERLSKADDTSDPGQMKRVIHRKAQKIVDLTRDDPEESEPQRQLPAPRKPRPSAR